MQANLCSSRGRRKKFVISAGEIELAARASRLYQFELHAPQNGGGPSLEVVRYDPCGSEQKTAVLPTCELLKSRPVTEGSSGEIASPLVNSGGHAGYSNSLLNPSFGGLLCSERNLRSSFDGCPLGRPSTPPRRCSIAVRAVRGYSEWSFRLPDRRFAH